MASLEEQFFDDFESSEEDVPEEKDNNASDLGTGLQNEEVSENVQAKPKSEAKGYVNEALQTMLVDIMQQMEKLGGTSVTSAQVSGLDGEASSEYSFVVRCVQMIPKVDNEIALIHRRLCEVYSLRFPELQTLILNPLDYARVVLRAGNATDFSKIDLDPILPAGSVITVQVTASSTEGQLLSMEQHKRSQSLANALVGLDSNKQDLLAYVESRAGVMAPNLAEIVGGAVAAALMGMVGGVKELAYMPSCNLKVVGKQKRILAGASTRTARPHEGIIFTCPLVASLPPRFRAKGGDVVAGKATLAARVDASNSKADGSIGRELRQQLEMKFEKWQEAPPAKTAKPLPIPGGEERRRHRGGKRARKEKERLGLTDVRKMANRIKFGKAEEVYGNDLENEGFGMLGEGSRKLRVLSKKTDTLSVAASRKIAKTRRKERREKSSAASGFATSLAFGSVQGIELGAMTPAPGGVGLGSMDMQDGTKSNYFSSDTPFLGVDRK